MQESAHPSFSLEQQPSNETAAQMHPEPNGLEEMFKQLQDIENSHKVDLLWKNLSEGVVMAARFHKAIELLQLAKTPVERKLAAGQSVTLKSILEHLQDPTVEEKRKVVAVTEFNNYLKQIFAQFGDKETQAKFYPLTDQKN